MKTNVPLQRKAAPAPAAPALAPSRAFDPAPEGVHPAVLRPSTGGSPLPPPVQAKMEASLGHNFSNVRVHQGDEATSIGALAFTRGSHVHFAPGQYRPHSSEGERILAHELTHVVQQREGRVTSLGGAVPINDNARLEDEANSTAARALSSNAGTTEEVTARGLVAVDQQVSAHRPIQRVRVKRHNGKYVETDRLSMKMLRKIVRDEEYAMQRNPSLTLHNQKSYHTLSRILMERELTPTRLELIQSASDFFDEARANYFGPTRKNLGLSLTTSNGNFKINRAISGNTNANNFDFDNLATANERYKQASFPIPPEFPLGEHQTDLDQPGTPRLSDLDEEEPLWMHPSVHVDVSEREACPSCKKVVGEFAKDFPGTEYEEWYFHPVERPLHEGPREQDTEVKTAEAAATFLKNSGTFPARDHVEGEKTPPGYTHKSKGEKFRIDLPGFPYVYRYKLPRDHLKPSKITQKVISKHRH